MPKVVEMVMNPSVVPNKENIKSCQPESESANPHFMVFLFNRC